MTIDIDRILPRVQRPARYIGHELNSYPVEKRGEVSVCLAFADLYEIGASNLGLEILYHLINQGGKATAERCYSPAKDMEDLLRKESTPLFSLETRTALNEFDIIGFNLQYELGATNILNMLDLAGIPVKAADRTAVFPLVIGGGPVTANPEPLADFFDAFVLGDGEEAIQDIIEAVRVFKQRPAGRRELLLALARIPGVYVPALYTVEYHADGTVASVKPAAEGVPAQVRKREVKLDESFFFTRKIVPYLQTVHDRLNIEIARGCPGRCRFCQASKYYWPWRVRPLERVLEIADQGLASTGFEEIAFSSLSCTDYRDLGKLLQAVNQRHGGRRINISLPSLRCDRFSLQVADNLGQNKRPSLTFAPEAGTERLRRVIGKYLPDAHIRETLSLAASMGWKVVKLYFMIGLPTETEADMDGMRDLLRSIRAEAKLNFTVTVSPFVPKAQTPFQWVAMAPVETLKDRFKRLEKMLPASVKGHHMDSSLLEGILARGDRRLGAAIFRAWEKGARFDQWREYFKFDLWRAVFAETGIVPEFYYRERSEQEVLPWEHLVFGADKAALREEYRKGLSEDTAEAPAITRDALIEPVRPAPGSVPATVTVQRLRLRFARRGVVRFVSHLEQIEVFRRAIRRSGLPLSYTAGFSPKPRMAFGPAISVGYESDCEYVEVELARRVEPEEARLKIAAMLPAGFALVQARKIPLMFPSLDSLVNLAEYRVGTTVDEDTIRRFLDRPEIIVEKVKENRVVRIDARPLIKELTVAEGMMKIALRFGPKKNVKPEKLVQLMCGLSEDDARLLPVFRTGLFIEKKDGSISEP